MANDHLKAQMTEDKTPFITFLRTENENLGAGMDEKKDVVWKCSLFDKNGGPFVWVGIAQIQFYLKKGWTITDYGNFGDLAGQYPQLAEVESLVGPLVEAYRAKAEAQAEVAALRTQAAELKAGRSRQ